MDFHHAILLFLLFSISISISISTTPVAPNNNAITAYQVLQEYDFPIGLLPNGVASYELDKSTGKFSAYMNSSCTFKIESYELKYKSTITGVITTDKLSSLTGIQVKVLFFWLGITEVIRDGDELEFSVGIASAYFAVSNFYECPTCGCGFDCDDDANRGMIRLKSSASLFSL